MLSYGSGDTDSNRSDPTGLTSSLKSAMTTRNTLVGVRLRQPLAMDDSIIEPFARITWQRTRQGAFDEGNAVAALGFSGYAENGVRTVLGVAGSSLKNDPLASANTYRFSPGIGYDEGGLIRPNLSASLAGIGTTITAPTVGRPFMQANVFFAARFDQRAYGYIGLNTEVREGLSDIGINVGVVIVL